MKKLTSYFTKGELWLYFSSIFCIVLSFILFDRSEYLTFCASLLGATSLILCAKGNPLGLVIMIVFSILYSIISYSFAYYGEMITYLAMSMPMSVISLVAWLKNPHNGKKSEVKISSDLGVREWIVALIVTVAVTVVFYFILGALGTSNLLVSTFSVTTSFIAVYLSYKRSPYFALAYALNDCVLIVLWILASCANLKYISVTVCFVVFLINDLYGFINWLNLRKKQNATQEKE